MDVLHFLKSDHDSIRASLDLVVAADGVKTRRIHLEDLAKLLQVHLVLERDYLYPEISGLFLGVDAVIDLGLATAALTSKRLKLLVKLASKPADEQEGIDKRVAELRESILKHFDHEEQHLLPKMRYLIRTEDREDLGQVFVDVRDDVMKSLEAPVAQAASGRKRA